MKPFLPTAIPALPRTTLPRTTLPRTALSRTAFLRALLLPAALLLSFPAMRATAQTTAPATQPHRFESVVQTYEAADKKEAPPKNAILLVGDSQFYRWKTLHEDLPGYTVINRGIDSFETSDLNYFFDRLVAPYHPRMIIVHVGGNDVHTHKTPAQILADNKTFIDKVRKILPTVPILISSTTPGPARWDEAPARVAINKTLKDFIATQTNVHFIDLWDAMLTPDGKPREDIWVTDRIHPNQKGYQIRVNIMKPLLGDPDIKK